MEELIPHICDWFSKKHEHLVAFAETDCRLEGWFKGELLVLFRRLVTAGVLARFEREANVPLPALAKRAQVDFRLTIGADIHLCELKALCISQAAGTPRNLSFYFRDDHVGILRDFRKLDLLAGENKWLIAFVYPAPTVALWQRALALDRPEALRRWHPVAPPVGCSPDLFVSLWTNRTSGS